MRNLVLLLLLANVLYFLWEHFRETSDPPGIAIVREEALGPSLELANPDAAEAATDTPRSAETPANLVELTGRSCVTVGPFREPDDADLALAEFQDDGLRASIRTTQGEVFVGHWVQIRNIESRAAAQEMLDILQEGGLGESYVVRTEDEGIKISIGLFGDMNGAERTELQAKSLGLPADITLRTRDATVFYVDIGLPPGRGAAAMIEQYGEDRVLLRDAATCPRND